MKNHSIGDRIDNFIHRNILPFCCGFFCGTAVVVWSLTR